MKNVISFSLWGTQPMYWAGAVKNVNLAREYFLGWICRFYIDNQSPRSLVEPIIRSGAEVVFKDRVDEFGGLFWRFLAASDPEVDAVVFRDCDSRISAREYSAVEAWLGSYKRVHIIRDHPYHNAPILGGMFGCKSGVLSNMDDFIGDWKYKDRKGTDQTFLAQRIYPIIYFDALEHSDFGIKYLNDIRPVPIRRSGLEFIGEIFDEHDQPNAGHRSVVSDALADRLQSPTMGCADRADAELTAKLAM